MDFEQLTMRVLVKKDYGACYDFYTEKLGLVPVWGDRGGPYTSFAVAEGKAPCFAMFNMANMALYEGYTIPKEQAPADTMAAVLPSSDLDADYKRLKEAGVQFIGEIQDIEDWGMRCVCFRDPEGNLFELNDASSI